MPEDPLEQLPAGAAEIAERLAEDILVEAAGNLE